MRDLWRWLQRAARRAAALPLGHRVNLALYVAVLLGLGLIALDIRSARPTVREVRPLSRPAGEITGSAPPAGSPPVALVPGDLTPVAPPAATGAAIEQSAAKPAAAGDRAEAAVRPTSGASGERAPEWATDPAST